MDVRLSGAERSPSVLCECTSLHVAIFLYLLLLIPATALWKRGLESG
jgi:hypothetical protein